MRGYRGGSRPRPTAFVRSRYCEAERSRQSANINPASAGWSSCDIEHTAPDADPVGVSARRRTSRQRTEGLDSLRFDIVAKAPEPEPIAGRMQLMMRALLAERFKLVVHHETRDLVAYTLLAEPSGPKVRVVKTDEPTGPNPFRMSDSGTLVGTRVSADMLATVLSNQLGRPVKNETGFLGVFDFTLQWTPESAIPPADAADRASLFEAIREQLGFRLVARRTATDIIVIDRVERTPTDN
jgi:uncharacterized protein (TIGR03435 family)